MDRLRKLLEKERKDLQNKTKVHAADIVLDTRCLKFKGEEGYESSSTDDEYDSLFYGGKGKSKYARQARTNAGSHHLKTKTTTTK